jgi:uncharacterized lipoprotein YehR (DUF1307 family)
MKNLIKLVGIIALIAVIGFSMVACGDENGDGDGNGDGNGDGKTITVSLNKVNATTFTLTVDGAKFKSTYSLIRDENVAAIYVTGNNVTTLWSNAFDRTVTNDTTITYTLRTATYASITGTIRLYDNLNDSSGRQNFDVGSKDTVVANPNKSSITF